MEYVWKKTPIIWNGSFVTRLHYTVITMFYHSVSETKLIWAVYNTQGLAIKQGLFLQFRYITNKISQKLSL